MTSTTFRLTGSIELRIFATVDAENVSHVPLTHASTDEASGRPAVIAAAAAELILPVLSTAGSTAETPLEPALEPALAATASTPPVTVAVAETVNQTVPPATCAF